MKSKSKLGLAGLALTTGLSGCNGVNHPSDWDGLHINWGADMGDVALGTAGALAIQEGYKDNNPALIEQGRLAGNIAASHAGRDETNQITNLYGFQSTHGQAMETFQSEADIRPHRMMFAARKYKGDINRNGLVDFPSEFEGAGSRFSHDENIEFYVEINQDAPFSYMGEIWKGDQFVSRIGPFPVKEGKGPNVYHLGGWTSEDRKVSGDYSVRCFVDDSYLGSVKFQISGFHVQGIKGKK